MRAGCIIEAIPSILNPDAAENPRPAGDGGAEVFAHSLQHNEVLRAHVLEAKIEKQGNAALIALHLLVPHSVHRTG
jgi:hypothetical protein